MNIKFADLEIYIGNEGDIVLRQFCFGDDDQVISFPPHQAKSICAAISKAVKSTE